MRVVTAVLTLFLSAFLQPARAQEHPPTVPVSTQSTLDASAPVQRSAINSVMLVYCKKTSMKGTGFALADGTVVTAAHVLCGCGLGDITAQDTRGQVITFTKLAHDDDRDIAALKPARPLQGGLELAPDTTVEVAERVNTWGFPLIYNGPAPLISVGYVSGYYESNNKVDACKVPRTDQSPKVTHIVVNGAFNPGNSGGPLFVFGQKKVVGLVIWKMNTLSEFVKDAVDGFSHSNTNSVGNFSIPSPDGKRQPVTDQQMIGIVLGEFYNKVQVDIGEAIAVSEVRKFLKTHADELR
jgi:S1-C subfamily serine protease